MGRTSVVQQVLSSPLYRGSTIALFLAGIGASAAAPQIVLFMSRELGAPLPVAGLYYLTSLAGPLAGYLVGRYSDRTGNRLNLFRLCAIAGFAGWAAMALSTALWVPFVVGALILGFSIATFSQLFAAVHDEQIARPDRGNDGVIAILRMANTTGWIIGPVIGAWVATAYGLRPLLWLTAICFLAQIAALGSIRDMSHPVDEDKKAPPAPATLSEMLPLLAFTGFFILVYGGESIKYGFLLIYMEEQLHIEAALRGAIIGLQPLVEVFILPFSIVLGCRFGMISVMAVGAVFCVAANLCFALWSDVAGMIVGQMLMGVVWGLFFALGTIVAQRLLPNAVATASAIFISSTALGSAIGGVAGGLGVATLGLPYVFFFPAAFGVLAAAGLAVMARAFKFR